MVGVWEAAGSLQLVTGVQPERTQNQPITTNYTTNNKPTTKQQQNNSLQLVNGVQPERSTGHLLDTKPTKKLPIVTGWDRG